MKNNARKDKTKAENTSIDKYDLSYEEEYEENGLCNLPLGTPVAEFSYGANTLPSNEPMLKDKTLEIVNLIKKLDLLDTKTLRPQAFGNTLTNARKKNLNVFQCAPSCIHCLY